VLRLILDSTVQPFQPFNLQVVDEEATAKAQVEAEEKARAEGKEEAAVDAVQPGAHAARERQGGSVLLLLVWGGG
jgi:hypothetical protein